MYMSCVAAASTIRTGSTRLERSSLARGQRLPVLGAEFSGSWSRAALSVGFSRSAISCSAAAATATAGARDAGRRRRRSPCRPADADCLHLPLSPRPSSPLPLSLMPPPPLPPAAAAIFAFAIAAIAAVLASAALDANRSRHRRHPRRSPLAPLWQGTSGNMRRRFSHSYNNAAEKEVNAIGHPDRAGGGSGR